MGVSFGPRLDMDFDLDMGFGLGWKVGLDIDLISVIGFCLDVDFGYNSTGHGSVRCYTTHGWEHRRADFCGIRS